MSERDRLRALQVRVPGHHRVDLAARSLDEGARQVEHRGIELVEAIDREHAEVERDLVIPASRGVQLSADVTDEVAKATLDDRVNVLDVGRPGERALLDLGADPLERIDDLPRLVRREDPPAPQHPGVSETAPDIVCRDPMVELK